MISTYHTQIISVIKQQYHMTNWLFILYAMMVNNTLYMQLAASQLQDALPLEPSLR
jgi:hypothetical protein